MNTVPPMSPIIERPEVTQSQLLDMAKIQNRNITLHQDSIANVTSMFVTLKEGARNAENSAKHIVEPASANKKKLTSLSNVLVENQKAVNENTRKIDIINREISKIQNIPPSEMIERTNKVIEASERFDEQHANYMDITGLPEKLDSLERQVTQISNDSAQVAHFVHNNLPDFREKYDRLLMFDTVITNALSSFTTQKDLIGSKFLYLSNLQGEISAANNTYNLNKLSMESIMGSFPKDISEKLAQISVHDESIKATLSTLSTERQKISDLSNNVDNKMAQMTLIEDTIKIAASNFHNQKASLKKLSNLQCNPC